MKEAGLFNNLKETCMTRVCDQSDKNPTQRKKRGHLPRNKTSLFLVEEHSLELLLGTYQVLMMMNVSLYWMHQWHSLPHSSTRWTAPCPGASWQTPSHHMQYSHRQQWKQTIGIACAKHKPQQGENVRLPHISVHSIRNVWWNSSCPSTETLRVTHWKKWRNIREGMSLAKLTHIPVTQWTICNAVFFVKIFTFT